MNLSLILLFTYLIFCSYTDIKKRYIYQKPTITISILISICQLTYILINNNNIISFLMSLIPGISMFILSLITGESIGYGDSILLALCAICVGFWHGFFIIMCSFIYSAIFSLFFLIKVKNTSETIPFVPFIFLGLISYLFIF